MGDGLLVLFGLDDPAGAALDAVRCGLEMLEVVEAMRPYLETHFGKHLPIGLGLHYGEVVLGTVGIGSRRQLTAIGDPVNLASRIESANKETGTEFLISQAAYEQVRDRILTGQRFELEIKGKTGTYAAYEVVGLYSHTTSVGATLDSTFIGRQLELTQLGNLIKGSPSGFQSATILAPASAGKKSY